MAMKIFGQGHNDGERPIIENTLTEKPDSDEPGIHRSLLPQLIFLIALPVLSIIGTFALRFQTNLLLLVMVFLLSIVPILVAFNKLSPSLYDVAIVAVSISLLYCVSLSTDYLWGADIHQEYYFASLVKTSSFWNPSIQNSYNAVLSIVTLGPASSEVLGLPLIWVFKAVYPFLFSFVPLILYRVFKRQTSSKMAFLSAFLFVSVFTFYTEMIGLARQQIAEVFLALLMLLIVDKTVFADTTKRNVLLFGFGALLVFSHYAVTYIFIFAAVFVLVLSFIRRTERTITVSFVVFCVALSVAWYTFIAGAVTFDRFVSLIVSVVEDLSQFLNPQQAQPLYILITQKSSLLLEVTRVLNILVVLSITLGLVVVTFGKTKERFGHEYVYFSMANFLLFAFSAVAPYLAASLNTTRLYHITLIVLAPFSIVGAVYFLQLLSRPIKMVLKKDTFTRENSLKVVSVVLAVFLLFNTGFVYEVANAGSSIVNLKWELTNGNARDRVSLYNSYTPFEEIVSAEWLSQYRYVSARVFADYRARNNPLNAYSSLSRNEGLLILEKTAVGNGSYIYLRASNLFDNIIEGPREATGVAILFNASGVIPSLMANADLIYSNKGSEVYYAPTAIFLNVTAE